MIKFIANEPALTFKGNLVIADIHIGLEYDLYKSGITIPSQFEKMKQKIDRLIKKTKAKRLIVLGDIKHQIPGVSYQELREVPEFFKHFSETIETHAVLGNHDSEVPALVDNIEVHDTDGFAVDSVYITHGHAWPKKEFLKCKYLIISHTHPLIEIKDKIGHKFVKRVWVKASFDNDKITTKYITKQKTFPEIILMPTFNDLSGGAALNVETGKRKRKTEETFLGPITKFIDSEKTEIYLLDGTYLGKLESLKHV